MSNIIYTVKTPELDNQDWWKVTLPTIQNYASKIGAELKIMDSAISDDIPNPSFIKIDCMRDFVSSPHDRMLFLDLDIYVKGNAPDIFNEISAGMHMRRHPQKLYKNNTYHSWMKNLGINEEIIVFRNSGVILADKSDVQSVLSEITEGVDVFFEANKIPVSQEPCINYCRESEGPYLNYFILKSGIGFSDLDKKWNDFRASNPHFIHFVTSRGKNFLTQVYNGEKEI